MDCFCQVKAEINFEYRRPRYNDFRDWFIVDDEHIKIHKTKIVLYLNDYFLYEDLMPIDTKNIKYKITSKVINEITIRNFKILIPEMGIEKSEEFPNPSFVSDSDILTIDGTVTLGDFE